MLVLEGKLSLSGPPPLSDAGNAHFQIVIPVLKEHPWPSICGRVRAEERAKFSQEDKDS
jgi:hypothetical protein